MRRTKDEVGGVEGGALGGGAFGEGRLVEPRIFLVPKPPEAAAPSQAPALFQRNLVDSLSRLEACARRLTGNPSDADDLVQATCVRALENWQRFLEGALPDFKKWVVTIMSNL